MCRRATSSKELMGDSGDSGEGAVLLGLPSYDGRLDGEMATVAMCGSSRSRKVYLSRASSSLLCQCFNGLWTEALNSREERGLKWFAMLHSDIIPEPWWIDKLIAEAEEHNADVMSAVVPIKNGDGATSTAIENPSNQWEPLLRLMLKQVNHPSFPRTFNAAGAHCGLANLPEPLRAITPMNARLLGNTGCFVARLDRPWAEKVRFTINDHIYRGDDGKFNVACMSEDWNFSLDVAALGGEVYATTKVALKHRGATDYSSSGVWGYDRDIACEKHGL